MTLITINFSGGFGRGGRGGRGRGRGGRDWEDRGGRGRRNNRYVKININLFTSIPKLIIFVSL